MLALGVAAWVIAFFWTAMIAVALWKLPSVPNVLEEKFATPIPDPPLISVIVPARNEATDIETTLRALLAAQGVRLEIIAVDDRSADATGAIMERVAAETPNVKVVHVAELPDGWLGKPHALAVGAARASAPWLLFTDGDVLFARDVLLRAMNFAERTGADHAVVFPTLMLEGFGERVLIAFFQAASALYSRFWRIPLQGAKEAVGVGGFNLIRADVYRAIGGFEALRMEVIEDLRLGVEVKRHGFQQRVAFGFDLVRIRWAVGAAGVVRNITKNTFAAFRFRVWLALAVCIGLAVFCLGPVAALVGPWWIRTSGLLFVLMLFLFYRYYKRYTGIATWYAVTFPLAACLSIYAILRSMALTLARGGVVWRGTFYPLADLRKNAGPLR